MLQCSYEPDVCALFGYTDIVNTPKKYRQTAFVFHVHAGALQMKWSFVVAVISASY